MVKFLNRPLAAIERYFRLEGAVRAPSTIDISAPIQPVLDVSGYAMEGLGQYQGLFRYDGSHVHSSGSSEKSQIAVLTMLQDLGLVESSLGAAGPGQAGPDMDFWVWLMQASMRTSSAANFSWAEIARQSPAAVAYRVLGGTPAEQAESLFQFKKVGEQSGYTGVGTVYPCTFPDTYSQLRRYPVLLYPGDHVGVRSTTTAAATITWSCFFWVGRAGSAPPNA